jgi:hypothetical protein
MLRFEPLGTPDIGGDHPRFGIARLGGPLTAWTANRFGRGSGESLRLAGQGLLEHLFSKRLPNISDGVLQRRQRSAPRGPGRAIKPIDQIFSNALKVKADRRDRVRVG